MAETKNWYSSKRIWTGIVVTLLGVYSAVVVGLASGCADEGGLCVHLPSIPDWIFAILGAFGIYVNKTATTTIK